MLKKSWKFKHAPIAFLAKYLIVKNKMMEVTIETTSKFSTKINKSLIVYSKTGRMGAVPEGIYSISKDENIERKEFPQPARRILHKVSDCRKELFQRKDPWHASG